MRDEHIYDDDAAESAAHRGWRPALGAGLSLCLLGGLVAWTYQLGVRDATEVPVIRAMEGEMRMRPDDPGGARFAHQERAVYAVIDPASGDEDAVSAAAAVEPLTDEDLPAAKLLASLARADAAQTQSGDAPASSERAAPAPVEQARDRATEAAPDPGEEVDRLVALVIDEAADAPVIRAAFVAPGAAAPRLSPAAPPRPSAGHAAQSSPPALDAVSGPSVETDAEPVAARPQGAQLQLGAYLTEGDANRMWAALRARNGDLMAGRDVAIFPVETDARTLWLLRAGGFASTSDAGAMCAALKARGEECFVVRGG